MSITFSSCFYIMKSKFGSTQYIKWMENFISIVNNFNLVIYTDENCVKYINTKNNPRITIIIKPFEQFVNYKYKNQWIENHKQNILLNRRSCWELNMLWSEKVWFVKETIERKYFDTDFYGWCDIGYFRNRPNDLHTSFLSNWVKKEKIYNLDKDKISYACINNDEPFMNWLFQLVNDKNENELPTIPIPPHQLSIAGGFFILYKELIHWWSKLYSTKLELYFTHNYLVKDDQIILADCILSNIDKFVLHKEINNQQYDNWFMFQRLLN